jgi:hypothetical protein
MLKLVALAARVLFFLLVIPKLQPGVLADYVFANSVSILGATLLVLGLDEELPRVIGGNKAKASAYMRWFYVLSAAGLVGISILLAFPGKNLAILAMLLTVTAGRILTGIIRSINPRVNEHIQNLPWAIFIAAVVVFDLSRSVEIIAAMTLSMALFQYWGVILVLKEGYKSIEVAPVPLLALVRHGLSHGLSRLASNFCLLGLVRGPILWPVWFRLTENLDSIAFAIAIGEVVAQFGRIPANHAYARWCRDVPLLRSDWAGAVVSSLLLSIGLFVLSSVGFTILWELGWLPAQARNIDLQIQALLLSSTVPGFRMLRYLLWSRGVMGAWIAILTFSMLLLSVAVIYYIDIRQWFYVLTLITLAGLALMTVKSRRYFDTPNLPNH